MRGYSVNCILCYIAPSSSIILPQPFQTLAATSLDIVCVLSVRAEGILSYTWMNTHLYMSKNKDKEWLDSSSTYSWLIVHISFHPGPCSPSFSLNPRFLPRCFVVCLHIMSLRGADKANLAEVQVIDPFVVHVVAMTCPVRGKQGNTWSLIHGTLPRHQISAYSDIGVSFARNFWLR